MTPDPDILWPSRIRALAELVLSAGDAPVREESVAELWHLLNLALQRYVRSQARRLGRLDEDEVVDVAADKSLDLMSRLRTLEWDVAATDIQLCAFLAAVARNGVLDLLRRRHREVEIDPTATAGPGSLERGAPDPIGSMVSVESIIDGPRYARALVACAGTLTCRARRAWVMRIFGGLPVARIARHPEVRTTLGGAHLMLNRARRVMRTCMGRKGFETRRMPPGTFVALWDLIDFRLAPGIAGHSTTEVIAAETTVKGVRPGLRPATGGDL